MPLRQRNWVIEAEGLLRIPLLLQWRQFRQLLRRVPNVRSLVAVREAQVDRSRAEAARRLQFGARGLREGVDVLVEVGVAGGVVALQLSVQQKQSETAE